MYLSISEKCGYCEFLDQQMKKTQNHQIELLEKLANTTSTKCITELASLKGKISAYQSIGAECDKKIEAKNHEIKSLEPKMENLREETESLIKINNQLYKKISYEDRLRKFLTSKPIPKFEDLKNLK